jgi:hypothetical protein
LKRSAIGRESEFRPSTPYSPKHMGEAARIAERFEPHLYEVSFVDEVK